MTWRRHGGSMALVLLALAALAATYVYECGTVSDLERRARPDHLFPAFRREDVTRFDWSGAGSDAFALVRNPKGAEVDWHVEGPFLGPADTAAVDGLLSTLDFASAIRRLTAEPSVFGAPRARGVVTLARPGRSLSYSWTLGGEAAMPEGAAYLRVEGRDVRGVS